MFYGIIRTQPYSEKLIQVFDQDSCLDYLMKFYSENFDDTFSDFKHYYQYKKFESLLSKEEYNQFMNLLKDGLNVIAQTCVKEEK